MQRTATRLVVLSAVLMFLAATAVFGQAQGVVATFEGTLSNPGQVDRIGFDVDSEHFPALNTRGEVDLVLLMTGTSSAQAQLDPGLLDVELREGSGNVKVDTRKPDTAGTTASIALVTVSPGKYDFLVRSEHKTTGAYTLQVFVAGDANGDLKVDTQDLQLISSLNATKFGEGDYSAAADVDRNGVINGGDRQRADANLGATAIGEVEANPLDEGLPEGALVLAGGSPSTFNSRSGLRFSLAGAEFDTTAADVVLKINGTRVTADRLAIDAHLLTAGVTLADGRNTVSLKAYDTIGRPLYFNGTVWAGSSTLRVNLVNPDGTAFTTQTNVVVALSDDPSVTAQGITTTGTVTFANVPSRTVIIKATGIGNESGTAGVVGSQGTVTVKMFGFNTPSTVDNNDFSQGTAGWTVGAGTPVWIVPHKEIIQGFSTGRSLSAMSIGASSIVDQDLMLGTSGMGERSVSRAFTTSADTTAVKIRYRFITSEVPGGYFGSQWNDYFRVSLRSRLGGGSASEANSMNGLGLGAFNYATGETDWREITLKVDKAGDTIQVDAGVANVGDGLYDSQVVIDFVEEIKDQVRPALAWNNTAGGLNLTWEVLGTQPLTSDVTIRVYFASGTGYANRLGTEVFTRVVPAGTAPGPGGPVHIDGTTLAGDPAGTTHLIAASSPTMVGAIADVSIGYGATADSTVVWPEMIDIIKDGLRAAGASHATISSTIRTPEDQARAMFQNTLRTGPAEQFRTYLPAGDAVIQVFVDETAGMTRAEILANAATIQQAMVDEINAQGPEHVSRHCGDPAHNCVVDVPQSAFGTNGGLFVSSVSARARLLNENRVYHIELSR